MRALLVTFILVVASPLVSLAQGDAAMAAARPRPAGQRASPLPRVPPAPAAKPAASPAKPAETAKTDTAAKADDAAAPVVATPADAAMSPALQARGFTYSPEGRRDPSSI
jgi:hypothetical protein